MNSIPQQRDSMDDQQRELFQCLRSPSLVFELSRKTGFLDDHLLLPSERAHDSVETPYLCAGKPYDNGSTLTYHYRRGWTDADVHDPGKSSKSDDEIGEFFQNLFFFGLLRDVLGFHINPTDFIQENGDGILVMTTKKLPDYIKRWYSQERKLPPSEKQRHAERAANALSHVCNIMHDWNVHNTSPLDDWMALYLIMLGQHFEYLLKIVFFDIANIEISNDGNSLNPSQLVTVLELFSRQSRGEVSASGYNNFDPSQMRFSSLWYGHNRLWPTLGYKSLQARMVADGWCQSDVQRLCSTLMAYGVYAAGMSKIPGSEKLLENAVVKSELPRTPAPKLKSRDNFLRSRHQQCSQFSCQAYQIDERNYETKHVSAGCACNQLEADTSQVVRILSKGQVPLMQIGRGVRIVPAKPGSRYVAISHVWSDGLGNPTANSLPVCQLIRLAVQCKALYFSSDSPRSWWEGSISFWIDTICCPVKDKKARARAISLMVKTYIEADRVLVIESSLLSRSIASIGPMELLLTIFCSKWQRRLWCLQERLLAKDRIRFQFKDGAISTCNAMLRAIPKIEHGPLRGLPNASFNMHDLTQFGCLQLHTITQSLIPMATWGAEQTLANLKLPSVAAMSTLQTLLPFRSTSRPADEALCLSNLLGVDTKQILDVPNDSRMQTLWKMMERIPPEMIFWIGPKLQTKGFRWAPKTFMNGRDWTILSGQHNEFGATLTKDGLKVHFPGWVLGCAPGRPIKAQFVMVDIDETIYTVSCLDCDTREYHDPDKSLNPWLQAGWTEGRNSIGTLYVLSRFDLDAMGNLDPRVSHDAILVLAYQKQFVSDTELLYARYICPVTVRKHKVEVGWTGSYIDWARIVQSRRDIDPDKKRLGLWCSDRDTDPGVIDLTGCSAFYESHPWIID